MVVIHVKNCGEHDEFLFETTCEAENDAIIREIVSIWNLRVRLRQLVGGLEELGMYGPMKKHDKVGIDTIQEQYNGEVIEKGEFYNPDPTGLRTGNGPGPQLIEVFNRVNTDTKSVLDKTLVSRKIALTLPMLQEKLDNIRGATMMVSPIFLRFHIAPAFPMGLPEWETVRLTIEGEEGLAGTAAGQEILEPNTAELWIASRCLDRSQKFCDRFGRNEKTKVIAKLQKPGAGAPAREPGVSEEERKAMMAFYFKKQEEMKKLAENDEDEYLNSSWADSKQLQRSLRGQSNIRAPGVR